MPLVTWESPAPSAKASCGTVRQESHVPERPRMTLASAPARSGPPSPTSRDHTSPTAAIVAGADVVVTGEGRYDGQSSAGKLPTYVAGIARDAEVPALLVAGAIAAEPTGFVDAVALSDLAGGSAAAIAEAYRWSVAAGAELARRFRCAPESS